MYSNIHIISSSTLAVLKINKKINVSNTKHNNRNTNKSNSNNKNDEIGVIPKHTNIQKDIIITNLITDS